MSSQYAEKFKDPRWQRKRLEVFKRDDFKCQHCGATEKTLHAHHLCYIKGLDPWDYEDIFIVTLCDGCHEQFHQQPGLSEYFLLKDLRYAEMQLEYYENQKGWDLSGVIRSMGKEEVTVSTSLCSVCRIEKTPMPETEQYKLKIVEEDY